MSEDRTIVETVGGLITVMERLLPRQETVYFTFQQREPTILSATLQEFVHRLRARDPDERVSCVTARRADWPADAPALPADFEVPLWIIGDTISAEPATEGS